MSSKSLHTPGILSVPRIRTLLASLLVALSSGTHYVYSAYAPQLGVRLHISHTQLNIIGTAGNFGVYTTGPVWGRIVDARGPRICLASAFVLLLLGYSGIRYIFDAGIPARADTISTLTLFLISLCGYMTGAGGHAGYISSINSTTKTFPDKARATAIGIVIAGVGLSTFLFSTLSRLFSAGDTSSLLLLLSIGTTVPMIIGFFLIRPVPLPPTDQTPTLERGVEGEDQSLLLQQDREQSSNHTATPSIPLSRRATLNRGPLPNIYGSKLFRSSDFWLIFSISSLFTGIALMFINNVGSMAQALYIKDSPAYDPIEAAYWQAAQVSTISLMSFSSRILIGPLSDFLKNYYSFPRSYSLTFVSSLLLASQLFTAAVDEVENLWIASAMLGFSYGMGAATFPMVCLDWFGMAHFSENWGYLCISPIIGSTVFSLAFGRILDAHGGPTKESLYSLRSGSLMQCTQGKECYVVALYLTAGASFVAVLLSVWAALRDRRKILEGIEARSREEVGWEGGYSEE